MPPAAYTYATTQAPHKLTAATPHTTHTASQVTLFCWYHRQQLPLMYCGALLIQEVSCMPHI